MNPNPLLPVDEALAIVLSAAEPGESLPLPLDDALGLFLTEDIGPDIDIPPFNKATMDGYALRAGDCRPGAVLPVVGRILAGGKLIESVPPGSAAKIMTGAPMPSDCDTVLPVELATALGGDRVRCEADLPAGRNVALRGEEMTAGTTVLQAGREITPAICGVLATCGREKVPVRLRPRLGILVTGNELINVGQKPGPGQIRDCNSYSLLAQAREWGAFPDWFGRAADTLKSIRAALSHTLGLDILILSGGVSAGDVDRVPQALEAAGVETIFHKVAQKPGKPLLFGRRNRTLVFGLPGNPVSTFVAFELYVGPAIRRMLGDPVPGPRWLTGTAAASFRVRSDRCHFQDAWAEITPQGWRIEPVRSLGSADLLAVTRSNALARFEAGEYEVQAGDEVRFVCHRGWSYGAQRSSGA